MSPNGPLGVAVSLSFFIASVYLSGVVKGQYFDPNIKDKTYLNNLQNKIETEVNSTQGSRIAILNNGRITPVSVLLQQPQINKRQFSLASYLPTALGNTIPPTMPTNRPASPRTPRPVRPVYPRPVNTIPQILPQQGLQPGQNGQFLPPPGTAPLRPLAVGQQGLQPGSTGQLYPPHLVYGQPGVVAPVAMAEMKNNMDDRWKRLGEFIKVLPDWFRGAREGIQILQRLSAAFEALDGLDIGDLAGGLAGGILQ